jgi:hypothetical protein
VTHRKLFLFWRNQVPRFGLGCAEGDWLFMLVLGQWQRCIAENACCTFCLSSASRSNFPYKKTLSLFWNNYDLHLQLLYEGCSESNAPHFFYWKLFIRNVWNSRTV